MFFIQGLKKSTLDEYINYNWTIIESIIEFRRLFIFSINLNFLPNCGNLAANNSIKTASREFHLMLTRGSNCMRKLIDPLASFFFFLSTDSNTSL